MDERRIFTPDDIKNGHTRPYKDLGLRGYEIFLEYVNNQYLEQLRMDMQGAPLAPTQCLIVVGSDGKRERHKQSKTDLVVVEQPHSDNLPIDGFVAWYGSVHPKQPFHEVFDLHSERMPQVASLGNPDVPVSYAYPHLYRQPARIYPDRILNSMLVGGSDEVFKDARRQVLHEMTDIGKPSRYIREEMAMQLKHYRKAIASGTFRDIDVFSTDPPLQFYDENPVSYSMGFKIPFLRSVQRYLDIVTTVAIRAGRLDLDEAVDTLPTSTVDRLNFMMNLGILPANATTEKIRDSYLWFLQQYHYAQELYKGNREPVSLLFDQEVFKSHQAVVIEFTSTGHYAKDMNVLSVK